MRNAVGSYILFVIVIFFVVLFSGYICISINKAKAFNTKNEIVKAVERYAPDIEPNIVGKSDFKDDIKRIMSEAGYRNDGKCEDGKNVQGYTKDGDRCLDSKCAFCIETTAVNSNGSGSGLSGNYYKITTFYHLDLPIISSVFNLKTTGETKVIYYKSKGA